MGSSVSSGEFENVKKDVLRLSGENEVFIQNRQHSTMGSSVSSEEFENVKKDVLRLSGENEDLMDRLVDQIQKNKDLSTDIRALQQENQGLTENIGQQVQINKELSDIIQQKSFWQQIKEMNIYLKVAVAGIPIYILAYFAIKRYLYRRQPSAGSGQDLHPVPWRQIHQTLTEDSEIKEDLLQHISNIRPPNDTTLNILLLGQAGSGKSSFVNACKTALLQDGRIVVRAAVGGMEGESVSLKLIPHKLEVRIGKERKYLPVQLFDCRGLFEGNRGVQTEDIKKICRGHIKANYLINPEEGIKSGDKKYWNDPKEKDKMHCIVFVLAANEVGFLQQGVEEQINEIKDLFREDTPQLILLTKIDRLGIKDIPKTFSDKRVKECCEAAAKLLNFKVGEVYPQASYSDEVVPCDYKDMITLFNIKTIIERANDRLKEPFLSDDDSS